MTDPGPKSPKCWQIPGRNLAAEKETGKRAEKDPDKTPYPADALTEADKEFEEATKQLGPDRQ